MCWVHPYLIHADVVAPLALNNWRIIINVQYVDGERVVHVSGRWAIVSGTDLKQYMWTDVH